MRTELYLQLRHVLTEKFSPSRLQAFLRSGQVVFGVLGLGALACYGVVTADTHLFQSELRLRFERSLRLEGAHRNRRASFLDDGAVVGRLEIPRIGLTAMVLEGVDGKTLRRAVGRIPGTALPGNPGNVGLAGHRDTFFNGLKNVRQNDTIAFTTLSGTYHYRVEYIQIVGPRDTFVLHDLHQPSLTLVTCYPFSHVGSAPERFVVMAEQISSPTESRD